MKNIKLGFRMRRTFRIHGLQYVFRACVIAVMLVVPFQMSGNLKARQPANLFHLNNYGLWQESNYPAFPELVSLKKLSGITVGTITQHEGEEKQDESDEQKAFPIFWVVVIVLLVIFISIILAVIRKNAELQRCKKQNKNTKL
ncbi:hypothetical protein SAMN06265379_11046 [Saccharicrinis carchari]|uniref:Uncharacterized protein n=1 Tax=Saccharicrinis carchari TaxID=1168039 RepID=A0A521EPC9_SACCC|nr:hypothetical protein [Saccharicrinis carchari]SMO85768.1 hypothetical protein SAMN06265379_11046 [Saccharicrinis carchari]